MGCILYELCTGIRAFANDFAVREFESPETLPLTFVSGLGEKFKEVIRSQWINQMLKREYENRPSAELLTKRFGSLVSSIIPNVIIGVSKPEMLGTDGPLRSSIPQWEDIFVPGNFTKQSSLFDRYHRVFLTRSMLLGVEHPALLWIALRLAWACMYRDDFEYAQQLFQLSLKIQSRTLGDHHHSVLTTRHGLARCLYNKHITQPTQEAYPAFKKLLDDQSQVLGETHPDTLQTRHRLAWVLYHHTDESRAFQQLNDVLATRQATLGPDHAQTIHALDALGWFHWYSAKYEEGIQLLSEAVANEQRILGMGHPLTVKSMACLAWCQHDSGLSNVPLLETVVDAARSVFGPKSLYVTSTLNRLAILKDLEHTT